MRNPTHELVGASLAVLAAQAADAGPTVTAVAVGGAVCGSWLPDVDQLGTRIHRRGRLERRSPIVGAVGALLRLPLVVFALAARHRGLTHSLIACVPVALFAAACMTLSGPLLGASAGGLALGYLAHVAADSCTPSGVRLWWPLSQERVWLAPVAVRVPTGSMREIGVAATVLALTVAALLLR